MVARFTRELTKIIDMVARKAVEADPQGTAEAKRHMETDGKKFGSLTVRIAAGMQANPAHRTKLLEAYAETRCGADTVLRDFPETTSEAVHEAADCMDRSARQTALALLENPRPIALMRRYALAGLKAG